MMGPRRPTARLRVRKGVNGGLEAKGTRTERGETSGLRFDYLLLAEAREIIYKYATRG